MARKKAPPNSEYEGLNKREALVYDYIKNFFHDYHYPPTVREICDGLNIPSTSTVHYYIKCLENTGYIRRDNNKMRAIELLREEPASTDREIVNTPLVGTIAAGTPILAIENISDYYPLPLDLFHPKNDMFMLEVRGDSMIEIGMMDGDYVILEKCETAENGQIVAAMIDGEATVKRFFREHGHIRLQPENSRLQPIITKEASIIGRVIGLFRQMN